MLSGAGEADLRRSIFLQLTQVFVQDRTERSVAGELCGGSLAYHPQALPLPAGAAVRDGIKYRDCRCSSDQAKAEL